MNVGYVYIEVLSKRKIKYHGVLNTSDNNYIRHGSESTFGKIDSIINTTMQPGFWNRLLSAPNIFDLIGGFEFSIIIRKPEYKTLHEGKPNDEYFREDFREVLRNICRNIEEYKNPEECDWLSR